MVTEIPLHVCLVVWRLWRTRYHVLAPMCLLCAVWIACMALFELAITIYLMHMTWDRWEDWRIATPIVFSLWICTQLYGGWNFFQMGMGARRKARANPAARAPGDDVETAAAAAAAATPEVRCPAAPGAPGKSSDHSEVVEIAPGGESVSSFEGTLVQSRTHLVETPLSPAFSSSSETRGSDPMGRELH